LLGALHGFKSWQMFEVRNLLETSLAALAAERGSEGHFTVLAEEVAEMYATIDDPAEYLIHDVRFHRTIAQASGNPILAALMETVSTALYEERRKTAERAKDRKMSMEAHREIYRAIRTGNPAEARIAMERHLRSAESEQATEQPARVRTRKRERKTEVVSA
jgi:GntR family transcriptional repressor for pyruvate dehydrogenase complex